MSPGERMLALSFPNSSAKGSSVSFSTASFDY
jgi:hypothetical protein